MSHELRTPLNAIIGFSNVLKNQGTLQGNEKKYVEIINSSGNNLLALINNILDLSKIESGYMPLSLKPFDLHDLINELIELMKQRANAKGLSIELEKSPTFPIYIIIPLF